MRGRAARNDLTRTGAQMEQGKNIYRGGNDLVIMWVITLQIEQAHNFQTWVDKC